MKHTIITISRLYGSGGRNIGHLISNHLGIPCYDRSIIDKTAKISELSTDFIEKNEQHLSHSFFFDITMTADIYKAQSAVIRDCAEKGTFLVPLCMVFLARIMGVTAFSGRKRSLTGSHLSFPWFF